MIGGLTRQVADWVGRWIELKLCEREKEKERKGKEKEMIGECICLRVIG